MIKKLRFLPILMILTAMVFMAFSPAEKAKAADTLADGIHLGTTDLSGMTLDEAADAMEEYYENIAASDLTINIRNIPTDVLDKMEAGEEFDLDKYEILDSIKIPVSSFDFDYDIEDALRVASTLGQKGRLVDRYKTLMDMKYGSAQLPLSYSIDSKKVKEYVEDVFVPENTQEAVDAQFSYSINGFHVTRESQPGVKVSAKLTTESILQAFENGISDNIVCNAMVGTVEPKVHSEDLKDVNFSLVATYTTKFWTYDTEANQNRSHNIRRAAELVNGTVVQPGGYCSLNQTIGQRTEARGFKIAHAYLNGKVIDDVGGGICQFATTLYQCLLQTELQINARKNHSMRVDYVDYSQDATLDWPGTDLAFTNNWKYPIYITCSTSFGYPSTVTVNFYSYDERPKNRTVEYKTVIDATDKTIYPQISLDTSKAAGTPSSSGVVLDAVSSHIEKIVRVNGVEQSRTRMNNDFYRSLRKIITVGSSGLGLTVSRQNDIDQVRDSSGNYLLLNSDYAPIYNGRGGYYLAKDYKHDANNVAVYSGGSLVPIGGGSTHSHSYSWKSNGNGTHTGTCSCGDKKTENCSYKNGKCTVCGYSKPAETTTAHEHSYSWKSNKDGTHTGTCSCGDKKTENCSYKNGVCTKCGYEKPSSTTEAHTHSYSNWKSNNDGTHTGKCSCGDTKKENCSYKNGVCTKCGYTKPTTPATTEAPHEHSYSWSGWKHNDGSSPSTHSRTGTCSCGSTEERTAGCKCTSGGTQPTTTSQGYTTHTCTVCGYSYKDSYTDPIHEHNYSWSGWNHNDGSSPSTHSRTGTCSCGDTKPETANCTFNDVVTEPTTTSQGYTTHTCTVCGYSYVDSYTDPLPTEPTEPTPGEGENPGSIRVRFRKQNIFLSELIS